MKSILFICLLLIYISNAQYSSSESIEPCYHNTLSVYSPNANEVQLSGYFCNYHYNLNVKVGLSDCLVLNVTNSTIHCTLGEALNYYQSYRIEVTQNGITSVSFNIFEPNINCLNGYINNLNQCVCWSGYTGISCEERINIHVSYISNITNNNSFLVSGYGWFGLSPGELRMYVELEYTQQIVLYYISESYFEGYAPFSVPGEYTYYIVDGSYNTVYSGILYYVYDTYGCLNNCNYNGICINSICSCNYGWYGLDCSSFFNISSSDSISSSTSSESTITCINSGNSLTITSFTKINCTGHGSTYCTDNLTGATCSTDQSTSIIECSSGSINWLSQNSLTCTGTNINCKSSIVSCKIDIEGSFHVNDQISNSNLVIFNDKYIQDKLNSNNNNNDDNNQSISNQSSTLNLNIILLLLIILSITLL